MVANIVGNYLIENQLLTTEQLRDLVREQRKVRVKLGLIAVAEGLMTQEETDKVNRLQTVMDKRFGDIAVEKGYLTHGQVEALLKKQGNAYLAFAQALENQGLMSIEQLEQYMIDYQGDHHMTFSDIDDLKSDDVDRILHLYMPIGGEKYINAVGTAVRTIMRCVDVDIYPEKAYLADRCEADNGAIQFVESEHSFTCALAGKEQALLETASVFGQEEFPEVNMDALDAIGELLNCINGLYATALSQGGISTELYPPEFSDQIKGIKCEKMLVIPLHVLGQEISLAVAVDHKINLEQEA